MKGCDMMWLETLKHPRQVKEKKEKPINVEKIFDHSFKEGKKVKYAPKEKKSTKELLYVSLNKDIKNKSFTKNRPI